MTADLRRIRIAGIFLLTLAAVSGSAEAVVTTALGDTYVSSATPTQNFGPAQTVNVSSQSIGLLRFDLSSLPAGSNANQIAKATLQLWVNLASPNATGSIDVYQVSKNWDGGTVTYNNRPTYLTSSKSSKPLIAGGSNYALEVDVTAQVKSWVTIPASNFGLAVVATGATNLFFDSKENMGTSHLPVLDITLGGGKTFAVCLNGSVTNQCNCGSKPLLSRVSGGNCQVSSDSGPCGAVQAGMTSDHPLASCCVCGP
jgi:hypothetical protein